MSGVTRQSYATEIRIIRLMCTGRVDLDFILRSFHKGADGVIIGGCWPGECHYVTEGNYDALGNVHLCRKLLRLIGMSPDRLRIEWIAASEGSRFAEVMSDFAEQLRSLGPLDHEEDAEGHQVTAGLDAVSRLIPYLKMVEREKFRIPVKSEEAYNEFYSSPETERLFEALVADQLAVSRILTLLEDEPLSSADIATALGWTPSELSRHLQQSSRHGLVAYDAHHNRYGLTS